MHVTVHGESHGLCYSGGIVLHAPSTANGNRYSRQALFRIVTPNFVQDSLRLEWPAVSQQDAAIVRCIVLRGIVSKYLSGRMSRRSADEPANPALWLRHYCQTVYRWRQRTREQLRRLLSIEHAMELHDLIREAVGKSFSQNYFDKVDMDSEEPINQIWTEMHNGTLVYTYDRPVESWLGVVSEKWVRRQLRGSQRMFAVAELHDEIDVATVSDQSLADNHADARYWDARIDLDRFQVSMSPKNQEILRRYRLGHAREEIAAQLGLTAKAVSNRLSNMRKDLARDGGSCN